METNPTIETEDIPTDTREIAALICAIAASRPAHAGYSGIAYDLFDAYPGAAVDLALDAWSVIMTAFDNPDNPDDDDSGRSWPAWVDAEAEVLIRSGWNPGDLVEVRR